MVQVCKWVHRKGIVNIIFIKSADNDSNILTKNLSAELHKKALKEDGNWEALTGNPSFKNVWN